MEELLDSVQSTVLCTSLRPQHGVYRITPTQHNGFIYLVDTLQAFLFSPSRDSHFFIFVSLTKKIMFLYYNAFVCLYAACVTVPHVDLTVVTTFFFIFFFFLSQLSKHL